ncbi:MAG TPA: chromosome segregation protein SMC, partial [Clostridiales bacterium]|nr:chromosome segregation protein SMC [Clostridiales bacterium]
MVEVSRLYLKTIEMQGFKSFAEKSVISFEPGVTAIVGPNGSGKSNISDAVRWVLGEMSAKSLRGGKMEDVIFNGTARRRPAAYAEVVLTIDNSNQVLEGAGQEVAVGRRLYRSGESEYSINGQVVRLKDVVNLFLNTGIGREGYSVIGQGKIAEIISQKGEERRGVFEEAAGISRYRYRKNEAQNKLAQFRENAIRISDIINEVQSRIPLLERQSEKAVQYEELVSERRLIEVSLLVKKLAKLDTERAQCLEKYEFRAEELRQLQEKLESIDGEMEARYRENQQENLLLAQKRALLEDTIREESTLSGRISVLENDIAHFKNAMTLNQGESGEQEKQKKELNLSLQKLEETIGNRRLELASSEQSLLRMQEGLQARERELNQLRGVIASAEAEISLLEENLKQAELEQRESESTNRLRGDRVQAIRRDLSFIANNVLKEEQELSDLQAFLQKTENNRAEILQKCQQNKEKMAE